MADQQVDQQLPWVVADTTIRDAEEMRWLCSDPERRLLLQKMGRALYYEVDRFIAELDQATSTMPVEVLAGEVFDIQIQFQGDMSGPVRSRYSRRTDWTRAYCTPSRMPITGRDFELDRR